MNDQASTLRLIVSNNSPLPEPINPMTFNDDETQLNITKPHRGIAIAGGKGGVGKSNVAVNLALELGKLLNQVALIDADFGLANVDLLCGISPKFHLGHVAAEVKTIEEITIMLNENVRLIPGGSGIEELANLPPKQRTAIFSKLAVIEKNVDFMLIDTSAGIAKNVTSVLLSAAEVLVVVTPEPTSIVDAYATIKTIVRHDPEKSISLVVNNVVGIGDAEKVFQQINAAARSFLKRTIEFLGMIPYDSRLVEAVREQTPIVQYAPESPASRAFRLLAKQFHYQVKQGAPFPIQKQSFWQLLTENNQ